MFDVCNDFNRLPVIIKSIFLNQTFYYETWSFKRNKSYSLSKYYCNLQYAEVPPDMMHHLEASFHSDIRFAGKHATYNSFTETTNFKIYAHILHYIITHRLKWDRILILNVQPSIMTSSYEFLRQKTVESKLCVQVKEVDKFWNISQEDYFTPKWFKENKPAVITIGDKYG